MSDLATTIKKRAKDLRRYFILDCCFAESAYDDLQDVGGSPASAAHTKSLLDFRGPGKGTALHCSSSARDFSRVPKGEQYTMFSGALLDVLRMGDVRLDKALSLEEVGHRVSDVINTKFPDKVVRPKVSSPDEREGDVADIPIFPNAALLDRSTDERVSNVEEKLMQILEKLKTLDELSAQVPSLQEKIATLKIGGKSLAKGEKKEGDTLSPAAERAQILKTAPPVVQLQVRAYGSARKHGLVWVVLSLAICYISIARVVSGPKHMTLGEPFMSEMEYGPHWIVLFLTGFSWFVLLVSSLVKIKLTPDPTEGRIVAGGEWETLPIVLEMRSNRVVRIFGSVDDASQWFEGGAIVYTFATIYLLAVFGTPLIAPPRTVSANVGLLSPIFSPATPTPIATPTPTATPTAIPAFVAAPAPAPVPTR